MKVKAAVARFKMGKGDNPLVMTFLDADLRDLELYYRTQLWDQLEDMRHVVGKPKELVRALQAKIESALRKGNHPVNENADAIGAAQAILVREPLFLWHIEREDLKHYKITLWINPGLQHFISMLGGQSMVAWLGRRMLKDMMNVQYAPKDILKGLMKSDPRYVEWTIEDTTLELLEDNKPPGGDPAYG